MLFLREWLSELLSVLIWILGVAGTIGMVLLFFWDSWTLGYEYTLPLCMIIGAFLLCWGITGIKMVEEK